MTYQSDEVGLTTGRPIELYKFTGTYTNYFMTSYSEEITSGGQLYTPEPISRNKLKVATQEKTEASLEITMPFDHPLIQSYAYENAPPDLTCEIIRVHDTDHEDSVTLWKGKVTSFFVEGQTAKIRVPSLFSYMLEGNAPAPRFQAPCNHILFDSRCGIAPSAHQHTTTVDSVVGRIIGLTTSSFSDGEAIAGVAVNVAGEQRMIISNVGTTFTLSYPFATLSPGDSITVRKGCDHALQGHCINRFNNAANFGGFPLVPDRNPFTSTLA